MEMKKMVYEKIVCPYCKSTIVNASHDFILSKKEIFEQRME